MFRKSEKTKETIGTKRTTRKSRFKKVPRGDIKGDIGALYSDSVIGQALSEGRDLFNLQEIAVNADLFQKIVKCYNEQIEYPGSANMTQIIKMISLIPRGYSWMVAMHVIHRGKNLSSYAVGETVTARFMSNAISLLDLYVSPENPGSVSLDRFMAILSPMFYGTDVYGTNSFVISGSILTKVKPEYFMYHGGSAFIVMDREDSTSDFARFCFWQQGYIQARSVGRKSMNPTKEQFLKCVNYNYDTLFWINNAHKMQYLAGDSRNVIFDLPVDETNRQIYSRAAVEGFVSTFGAFGAQTTD